MPSHSFNIKTRRVKSRVKADGETCETVEAITEVDDAPKRGIEPDQWRVEQIIRERSKV